MLEKIQLLRNVGQFDNVNSSQFNLAKLTMIYAENGRGKTTLAAILRSAATGDATLIEERHRLTAQHPAHIVLQDRTGALIFQNGAWSRTIPEIAVFDDKFVSDNICSGIELETDHRQNLHELILGAQGVTLNAQLQQHVAAIEQHNKRLKTLPDAIPAIARGRLSVDAFCALEARTFIDQAIEEAERGVAAAKAADSVRTHALFLPLSLPVFDVAALNKLLHRGLPNLEAEAAAQVQAHMRRLGENGEEWVADGVPRIVNDTCPFCAQDLQGSPLIAHYQAYFSAAYIALKTAIVDQGKAISATHGGDMPAAFERAVRVMVQTHEFWSSFVPLPVFGIDTAEVARAWKDAREKVLAIFRAKHLAPLDRMELPAETIETIDAYHLQRDIVLDIEATLLGCNAHIEQVRERAANANVANLEGELATLHSAKARHTPAIHAACQAYLDEKAAKLASEQNRDQARTALDRYRTTIFPIYETAINDYLGRFGASFRLGNVIPVNNRGGSSCTYSVLINAMPVSVTAATGPSFHNTLSAGDRNTLALAFFFACLDQSGNLADKIVVIDDPMTSLDEHRNRNTLAEMRRLLHRVDQMIVLSHSKPFLCPLWQDSAPTQHQALRIDRMRVGQNQDASTLTAWNVHSDCVQEHDRRHERVQTYIQNADSTTERDVAMSLRPMLEAFVRVAYPSEFPPGSCLGAFINVCAQRQGTHRQILNARDTNELNYLREYANEFHHDTNPAYQTVIINGQELTNFCVRTIAFTRRS